MNPPWSDAILADLALDYPPDAHEDVADLIAGVRRVLALHQPWQGIECCVECCPASPAAAHVMHPCATVRLLNDPNGA